MPQMRMSGRTVPAGNVKVTMPAVPVLHTLPSNHLPAFAPVQLTGSADGRNGTAKELVSVAMTEPTVGVAPSGLTALYSVIVRGWSNVVPGVVVQSTVPVPV